MTLAWEDEFFRHKRVGVRQVALRISFILGRESGAFPLLAPLHQWRLVHLVLQYHLYKQHYQEHLVDQWHLVRQ